MIQINLVPDVKQEMLRAQRMRNITISMSIVAGLIAGGAVVVMGLALGAQAVTENLVAGQIDKEFKTLQDTKDIDNALTIQNQLNAITGLNDKRTIDSRLLDVLAAINPAEPNNVTLSRVTLDPTATKLVIEGSAVGGYPATEVFRKTILNATVTGRQANDAFEAPLTEEVTLQDTSYGQDAAGNRVVRFTISFIYPAGLFDNTLKDVKITTPSLKIDVTDSRTRVPDSMFSQPAADIKEEQ